MVVLTRQFALGASELGNGAALCAWHTLSGVLAVCGVKGRCMIVDGKGEVEHQFAAANVVEAKWQPAGGDVLALVTADSAFVLLYNHRTRKLDDFDAGVKELCTLAWSRDGASLAIATQKGSFVLYHSATLRKVPIVGTHSQRIVSAAWTLAENRLVMVGADLLLSVSNAEGNVVSTTTLSNTPVSLTLLELARAPGQRGSAECTAVVNLGNRLQLVHLHTGEVRMATFGTQLGQLTGVTACSERACIISSANGTAALAVMQDDNLVVRTTLSLFSGYAKAVAYSEVSGLCAAIGDSVLHALTRSSDTLIAVAGSEAHLDVRPGVLKSVAWSCDGQRVCVTSALGDVVVYTVAMMNVGTACGSLAFYCIAPRVVAVRNMREGRVLCNLPVDADPAMLAAGVGMLAVVSSANAHTVLYYQYYIPNTLPVPQQQQLLLMQQQQQSAQARRLSSAGPASSASSSAAAAAAAAAASSPPDAAAVLLSGREARSALVRSVDYAGVVTEVRVSSRYAAVLYDGRVHLHTIYEADGHAGGGGGDGVGAASGVSPMSAGGGGNSAPTSAFFPPPMSNNNNSGGESTRIVGMDLSETLLVYATPRKVCVVALARMQTVAEYTARMDIRRAFANPTCTRVAFINESNMLYVLNPITEIASQAEGFDADHKTVLWDQGDASVFVTHNGKNCVTFVCAPYSRHGATCESVLVCNSNSDNLLTPLPADYKPLNVFRGVVVCQSSSGMLDAVPLRTHAETAVQTPNATAFYNNFSLNRLRWASQNISTPSEAEDLAVKALHMLDLDLAIRVYRQLSQPSLVLCLEKLRHIHEKNLLIGHISMIMGYFKEAQTFFLRSSQPRCALDMRRDLMQWEPALALAHELAEDQVPILCAEYAQQLEYRGEYGRALEMYTSGRRALPTGHASTELNAALAEVHAHNRACEEGAARCQLRSGNVAAAMAVATQSPHTAFVVECAKLCEEGRHYNEAAQLYECAGDVERAASLYIEKAKNLTAAAALLPRIASRNILVLYAKAKEDEAAYEDAARAYAQAGDFDNVVRLKVEQLGDLPGAYELVRTTRSAEAAAAVARVCQQRGEYGAAVEFLVLARSTNDAFALATAHNCVVHYENALLAQVQLSKDGVAPPSYAGAFAMVAEYHDKAHRAGQAGLFYQIAGNYAMALTKYMEAGEAEDIDKAVEVVGKARSDSLTNRLIDFLMGETDGEPKDPTYIFKLYMALGSYEKAAKTSVIIASKEQEMGNYKAAHKTLVEACRLLADRKLRVPNDLRRALMLLHSYVLVKDVVHVLHDSDTACRLLLRVARNIQRFPAHMAEIVASAVVLCLRAGFAKSAFELACSIVQNEKLRLALGEKQRKKVEGVVRRRGRDAAAAAAAAATATAASGGTTPASSSSGDPMEQTTPCPFCEAPVPATELDCGACKNTLPFCAVTGKHLVREEVAVLPCCGFPALHTPLQLRLRTTPLCPMCGSNVDVAKVTRLSEPDMKAYV